MEASTGTISLRGRGRWLPAMRPSPASGRRSQPTPASALLPCPEGCAGGFPGPGRAAPRSPTPTRRGPAPILGHASVESGRRYARLADNALVEVLRTPSRMESDDSDAGFGRAESKTTWRQAGDKTPRTKPEQNRGLHGGPPGTRTLPAGPRSERNQIVRRPETPLATSWRQILAVRVLPASTGPVRVRPAPATWRVLGSAA